MELRSVETYETCTGGFAACIAPTAAAKPGFGVITGSNDKQMSNASREIKTSQVVVGLTCVLAIVIEGLGLPQIPLSPHRRSQLSGKSHVFSLPRYGPPNSAP